MPGTNGNLSNATDAAVAEARNAHAEANHRRWVRLAAIAAVLITYMFEVFGTGGYIMGGANDHQQVNQLMELIKLTMPVVTLALGYYFGKEH